MQSRPRSRRSLRRYWRCLRRRRSCWRASCAWSGADQACSGSSSTDTRRGADRLIYSSDGLIYLTRDHYRSFRKVH
ncbi:hypothetical protein CRX72_17070 [Pantoea sp. BRM17]|nr:hypothetical protein CRX72_17070 [Pantoea sp. BRM17]